MDSAVAEGRRKSKSVPAICLTDDDTVGLGKRKDGEMVDVRGDETRLTIGKEIRNKQSWDYIWRTGLAGGLAGSAVCILISITITVTITTFSGLYCGLYSTQTPD